MKVLNDLKGRSMTLLSGLKCARLRKCEEGSNLVEFALVLPVLLTLLTGILSVGTAMMNYESLTHGVTMAADYLVAARASTTDPCKDVLGQITANAPTLDSTKINVYLSTSGGNTASGSSCADKQSILAATQNVTVKATYPCNIGVYGVSFSSSCLLTASLTEYEY
jgi:Flp pilus assembly protein TadG